MIAIVSDNETEYTEFMAKTIDEFAKHKVTGLAVVALTDEHLALTAYWNMSLRDKLQAESEIRFDSIDAFLLSNAGRYCVDADDNPEG